MQIWGTNKPVLSSGPCHSVYKGYKFKTPFTHLCWSIYRAIYRDLTLLKTSRVTHLVGKILFYQIHPDFPKKIRCGAQPFSDPSS